MQFTKLYTRYGREIEAEFKVRVRCPHLAKDLSQAFYVKLLEKPITTAMGRDEMAAYLRVSIQNFIRDFWGSQEQRFESTIEHLSRPVVDPFYEQQERVDTVRSVLHLLPEDQRQVIEWALNGQTIADMSRRKGMTRTTFNYLYYKAVDSVRRLVSST